MLAAPFRSKKLFNLILRFDKSNINQVSITGVTALSLAVKYGCAENVKILLENGADPVQFQTKNGLNLFHLLAESYIAGSMVFEDFKSIFNLLATTKLDFNDETLGDQQNLYHLAALGHNIIPLVKFLAENLEERCKNETDIYSHTSKSYLHLEDPRLIQLFDFCTRDFRN